MPVYSSTRPVKILIDDSKNYVDEHMTFFFNTFSSSAFLALNKEKKERVYKLLTHHENMLIKIFGNSLLRSIVFLPELLRNSADVIEVPNMQQQIHEYREWLDKQ